MTDSCSYCNLNTAGQHQFNCPSRPTYPPRPASLFTTAARASKVVCVWTQNEDGWGNAFWETSCDNGFEFNDGTPSENSFCFCPYCGLELVEAKL